MDSSQNQGRRLDGAPAFPFADRSAFLGASLAEQERALAPLRPREREVWLLLLEGDSRRGRRQLAQRLRRRALREVRREERWRDLSSLDAKYSAGLPLAGVDEVGRGPLAGPVTAAALILPPGWHAPGLDDSKRLTPRARETWSQRLQEEAVAWAVADVAAADVDALGIRAATFRAMTAALAGLATKPARILVDGNELPASVSSPGATALVGGDRRSLSVAGASVLAKVHRDALLIGYDERWPGYGFARHKGYASEEHCRALLERGPCPLHRRSFCERWIARGPKPGRARASG